MAERFDLILTNLQYVNLFTKEIYPAEIAILNGKIARITQPGEPPLTGENHYDAQGKFALPGLIDTHLHIESSLMGPKGFCGTVLPHGTTTVFADPHEIANVMGLDGMRYMLRESEGLPMEILFLAPSCVPSVVGLETSQTIFDAPEIANLLSEKRMAGLGEVMDYPGVIKRDSRMQRILAAARASGKFIQGHAPGLRGQQLADYLAAGVESDHETHAPDEALEKLRAGMVLECRNASNCRDLEALAPVIIRLGYPENVTFCTDDCAPGDLLKNGHMDYAVRTAIRAGLDPIEAFKIATVNAARLGRLHDRGSLRPGYRADILLLHDLESVSVDEVFTNGKLAARGGCLCEPLPQTTSLPENTVKLQKPITQADFCIRAEGKTHVRLHTICYDLDDRFVTKLGTRLFPVEDGSAQVGQQPDFALFAVLERHGINGNRAIAPVRGVGLKEGAVATTISHDSHNLFVLGRTPEEMLLAAQTVVNAKGGVCCVRGGQVTELLELPIAGLMSDAPAELLAQKSEQLQNTLREMGILGDAPLMILGSFALAVIPEVRLTDVGLVDTVNQKKIPLFVEEDETDV
ncbi:adenine deaminase [Anaerotruncus sp.]|jgi:adenine deaminase|uniref:adenine deaminase n=1 Tax=Anaerotruncus TaxID=244127 RepID=UPI0021747691|nr:MULTISPECIES: adenine deaminase [Anaerotruncus]MCI8492600.1 adenine deaminase [Anaerotruncus sp.]